MLKGQAKKDYQRNYMKIKRAKMKLNGMLLDPSTSKSVRPSVQPNYPSWKEREDRMPEFDADGHPIPEY